MIFFFSLLSWSLSKKNWRLFVPMVRDVMHENERPQRQRVVRASTQNEILCSFGRSVGRCPLHRKQIIKTRLSLSDFLKEKLELWSFFWFEMFEYQINRKFLKLNIIKNSSHLKTLSMFQHCNSEHIRNSKTSIHPC